MVELKNRFERVSHAVLGGKVRHWWDGPPWEAPEKMESGLFLGKLWALFGPALPQDDGFDYNLRHRPSGLELTAYSGASGPAFGGVPRDLDRLHPVLAELDELLDRTEPVECCLRTHTDYGVFETGFHAGQAFSRHIRDLPDGNRDA